MSSYQPVLFDASQDDARIEPDQLAFQDFGHTTDGRLSPQLFAPEESFSRQLSTSTVFSLDYYTKYFDVDSKLVLERAWHTLYPREDFIQGVLNDTPDLYGPFWLPTTLIFALFLSSSLAASISAYLAGHAYAYDFTRLSVAVSTVYVYSLVWPIGLWAGIRYWAGIEERSAIDVVALYGYSMVVWIPAALLCIPPILIARFVFSLAALLLSIFFLLRNLYPLLASGPALAGRVLLLALSVVHLVFAVVLWFGFLNIGTAIKGADLGDQPAGDV